MRPISAARSIPARAARWLTFSLSVVGLAALLDGCYYLQAAGGQIDLMLSRQDLDELIDDPATAPELRQRLAMVRDARDFAHAQLSLPDNGSYSSYVELDRDFVVWNVFAAPELSLEPKRWCFPVAGCVVYRGHFRERRARGEAKRLAADGYDVFVAGVPAYSTLGRLRDPILSSMFRAHPHDVVATLFHELAHQVVYVPDDTTFNESFATAVADLGMERWFATRDDAAAETAYRQRQTTRARFLDAALATRAELEALYESSLAETDKRRLKERAFDELSRRYAATADELGFVTAPPAPSSNAALVPIGSYFSLVERFVALFRRCERDFGAFYEAVTAIGAASDAAARETLLESASGCMPDLALWERLPAAIGGWRCRSAQSRQDAAPTGKGVGAPSRRDWAAGESTRRIAARCRSHTSRVQRVPQDPSVRRRDVIATAARCGCRHSGTTGRRPRGSAV